MTFIKDLEFVRTGLVNVTYFFSCSHGTFKEGNVEMLLSYELLIEIICMLASQSVTSGKCKFIVSLLGF